jgi:hypothetical protein
MSLRSSSPLAGLRVFRFSAELVIAVSLVLLMFDAPRLQAQTAASANVTASVSQPLSVSATNGLAFGTLFPGNAKTVAVTDAAAAAFSVSGAASGNVSMTFSIPNTITSGGNSLTVDTWTARRNTSNSAASGTDFTPSASATQAVLSGSGNLYVFVGATAHPGASQAAGAYTGTLTLTVVYF